MHRNFFYTKPFLFSNGFYLYSNSPMQWVLMCIAFLATQGYECIAQVELVVLHHKLQCETEHFGTCSHISCVG